MAGVLPTLKRYFENNDDGLGADGAGRRVTMEELKALTEQDRADFKAMLAEVGIATD